MRDSDRVTPQEFQRASELYAIYNREWTFDKKGTNLQIAAYREFRKNKEQLQQWVIDRPYNQGPIYEAARALGVVSFHSFVTFLLEDDEIVLNPGKREKRVNIGATWQPFRLLECPFPKEQAILQHCVKRVFREADLPGSFALPKAIQGRKALEEKRQQGEFDVCAKGGEPFVQKPRQVTELNNGWKILRLKGPDCKGKRTVSFPTYYATPFSHLYQSVFEFAYLSFARNFFHFLNLFLPIMAESSIGRNLARLFNFSGRAPTDAKGLALAARRDSALRYILTEDGAEGVEKAEQADLLQRLRSEILRDYAMKDDDNEFVSEFLQSKALLVDPFWSQHVYNCYILVDKAKQLAAEFDPKMAKHLAKVRVADDLSADSNQKISFLPPATAHGPTQLTDWRYSPLKLHTGLYYLRWLDFIEDKTERKRYKVKPLISHKSFRLGDTAREAYQYALDALDKGPRHEDAHRCMGWFSALQDLFEKRPFRHVTGLSGSAQENANPTWIAYAFFRLHYTGRWEESVIWLAIYCLCQDASHGEKEHLDVFRVLSFTGLYAKDGDFYTLFVEPVDLGFRRLFYLYRLYLGRLTRALYATSAEEMTGNKRRAIELDEEELRSAALAELIDNPEAKRNPTPSDEQRLAYLLDWRNSPLDRDNRGNELDAQISDTPEMWDERVQRLCSRISSDLMERTRTLIEWFYNKEVNGFFLYRGFKTAPDLCRERALRTALNSVLLTIWDPQSTRKYTSFLRNLDPELISTFDIKTSSPSVFLASGGLELCVPRKHAERIPLPERSGQRVFQIGDGDDVYSPYKMKSEPPKPIKQERGKKIKVTNYNKNTRELKQEVDWPIDGKPYHTYHGATCFQFLHQVLANTILHPIGFFLEHFLYSPTFSSICGRRPDDAPSQWDRTVTARITPRTMRHGRKRKEDVEKEKLEEKREHLSIVGNGTAVVPKIEERLRELLVPFHVSKDPAYLFSQAARDLRSDLDRLDISSALLRMASVCALGSICHDRLNRAATPEDAARLTVPRERQKMIDDCGSGLINLCFAFSEIETTESNFVDPKFVMRKPKPTGSAPTDLLLLRQLLDACSLATHTKNPFEQRIEAECERFRLRLCDAFAEGPSGVKQAHPELLEELQRIYNHILSSLADFDKHGLQWFPVKDRTETETEFDPSHFRLLGNRFSNQERSAMALVHCLFDCKRYKPYGTYPRVPDEEIKYDEWTVFMIQLMKTKHELRFVGGTVKDPVYIGKNSEFIAGDKVAFEDRWLAYVFCAWASVCGPRPTTTFRYLVDNDNRTTHLKLEFRPPLLPAPEAHPAIAPPDQEDLDLTNEILRALGPPKATLLPPKN